MIKVSPSILAADFANLQSEIKKVKSADMLHIDVMDGHFVPNLSIGIPVVQSIRKCTDMFFDVHLMISDPMAYLEDFCNAGADSVCVHYEADGDIAEIIQKIHSLGKKAAVALKPQTPTEVIFPYLADLEMVLLMTVEPGFGGQKFMESVLPKIKTLSEYIKRSGLSVDIEVDGGINSSTAKSAVEAGATVLVAGSSIFLNSDPKKKIAYFSSL